MENSSNSSLPENFQIYVFVFLGGIVLLSVLVANYRNKQRRESLKELALRHGFTFLDTLPVEIISYFKQLSFYNIGRSQDVCNVLTKKVRFGDVFVCDYSRVTGSGRSRTTTHYPAVLFAHDKKHFPSFSLRPENFLDRVGSVIGFDDIDFPEAPEFSKKYLLKGNDETAIRRFFTPTLIKSLEMQQPLTVEANDQIFLVVKKSGRLTPENAHALYDEALNIFSLFR